MTVPVDICNRVLLEIGARSTVSSLTEDSNEANTFNIVYTNTRQEILSMAPWDFARAQGYLSQIGSAAAGTAQVPWQYEYSYPSDAVFVRFIMAMASTGQNLTTPIFTGTTAAAYNNMGGFPVQFIVASEQDAFGNQSKVLLTNQYQALAVWTRDITNLDIWSPQAVEALVGALCAKLVVPLTGNVNEIQSFYKKANAIITDARATDGNEGLTIDNQDASWIKARNGAANALQPWVPPYPPLYSTA